MFFDALNTLLELDKEWIPKGKDKSLYIRPFIFASDEYIGMRPSETYKFVIFTCPVSAYYSAPVKVKIETHFTRAPLLGGTGSVKASGNYGGTLYPARLAKEEGYDQLIWTDSNAHKYLEEAGTMNVFFVIDGVVITPDLGDSILPGVTRQSVLELAKSWGLKTEERKISIEEIISAIEQGRLQEAFGTGTAATITSIELIGYNNTKYPLPILSETSFSKKILNYLDSLKAGEIEDKFGWLYKIKN